MSEFQMPSSGGTPVGALQPTRFQISYIGLLTERESQGRNGRPGDTSGLSNPKVPMGQNNGDELTPQNASLSQSLGNGSSWDIWGKRAFMAQGSQGISANSMQASRRGSTNPLLDEHVEGKTGSSALGGEYDAWPAAKSNWVGGTSPGTSGTSTINQASRSPGRFHAETNGSQENRSRQGSPSHFFSTSFTGNSSSLLDNARFSESLDTNDSSGRGRSTDGRKAFGKHQRFKSVGQSVFDDDRRMQSMLGGLEPEAQRGRVMSTSHALDMMGNLGGIGSNVDRSESLPPRQRNHSISPYENADNYNMMPNQLGHQSQSSRSRFEEYGRPQQHDSDSLSAFRHLSIDEGPDQYVAERRHSLFAPYTQNPIQQNPYPRLSEYTFPRNEVNQRGAFSSYSPWNRAEPQAGSNDMASNGYRRSISGAFYTSEVPPSHMAARHNSVDIYNHVVEFSGDQHGSRFIQQKLEPATSDEKDVIFSEIRPNALQLMTDVFGNYVIQKFFEHGNQLQKAMLAKQMEGHVLKLSLQMYGCRVVQKALEHVLTEQQATLIKEIDGNVLKCVKDQNGNHVVQKAIERVPAHHIEFILKAFKGQVQSLATHPYGCRVIQRMLEHCDEPAQSSILQELNMCLYALIQDQYGNYVTQHVLEHGKPEDRAKIIHVVTQHVIQFSKHKFASNVVEKSIQYGNEQQRKDVLGIIVTPKSNDGPPPLQILMKDQYGNYVIQKLLFLLDEEDRDTLIESIKPQLQNLKRFSYGKQLNAIEKLIASSSPSSGAASPPTHSSVAALPVPSTSEVSSAASFHTSSEQDTINSSPPDK
ncbi:hypothetical protein AA313_de0208309 [Arthrobotrys entomopaga]|nr:hypothetical protein AA313_de0208309 [Arthrobotrys entomopaga]